MSNHEKLYPFASLQEVLAFLKRLAVQPFATPAFKDFVVNGDFQALCAIEANRHGQWQIERQVLSGGENAVDEQLKIELLSIFQLSWSARTADGKELRLGLISSGYPGEWWGACDIWFSWEADLTAALSQLAHWVQIDRTQAWSFFLYDSFYSANKSGL